jgi:hypothetical protein
MHAHSTPYTGVFRRKRILAGQSTYEYDDMALTRKWIRTFASSHKSSKARDVINRPLLSNKYLD